MTKSVLLPMFVALTVSVLVVVLGMPDGVSTYGGEEMATPSRRDPPAAVVRTPIGPEASAPAVDGSGSVDDRIRALEQRIATLEGHQEVTTRRVASLREEISGPDPRDLDDEALLTKAHGLYSQKDYADAVRYFEELLKRDLTPTKRGEVLRSLGFSCRMSADHVKSEKVFRKLLAHHGEGTADGMFALYHVAWSRFQQDDAADARDIMDRVASTPHTADVWKIWARANAADFSIKLGDKARARASLESLKADLADDASPTGTRVKAYVEQMLGRLES